MNNKNMNNKIDFKSMGFNTKEEYDKFLKSKMDSLMDKIVNNPKILDVFKRLKDK
jgi:hypothetical protein